MLVAVGLLLPTAANATDAIHSYSFTPSTTQAGGHPDLELAYSIDNHSSVVSGEPCNCNDPKNLRFELPAGLIANPHATPQCTSAEFAREECPIDSQVGIVLAWVNFGGPPPGAEAGPFRLPLYNLVPKPTQAGLLAWSAPLFDFPIYEVVSARTGGDYGLDIDIDGIEHVFPIQEYRQQTWGVPADPSHNLERYRGGPGGGFSDIPSNSPLTPLIQNPTTCVGELTSTMRLESYDGTESTATAAWPPTTGCDSLTFNPSLSAQPTTADTDSASGLEADLSVPQPLSPEVPSPSEIKALMVELPPGFSINPSAADGKTSCTDAQARFGTAEEADCPEYSTIGTVSLESSALPALLPGNIYLGEPEPGDRYRIFLTANGFATHVKLAGTVTPSPQTGQLLVLFPEPSPEPVHRLQPAYLRRRTRPPRHP